MLGFSIRGFIWEFPKIRGTLFEGPYNKDLTILGTILGPPIFGNSHMGYPHRTFCLCAFLGAPTKGAFEGNPKGRPLQSPSKGISRNPWGAPLRGSLGIS